MALAGGSSLEEVLAVTHSEDSQEQTQTQAIAQTQAAAVKAA